MLPATRQVLEAEHLLVDHADAALERFARAARGAAGSPRQWISPASGWTMPARIFSSVDLPAPFSPISPCASPSATENVTPRSALTAPNDLRTSRNWRPMERMDSRGGEFYVDQSLLDVIVYNARHVAHQCASLPRSLALASHAPRVRSTVTKTTTTAIYARESRSRW